MISNIFKAALFGLGTLFSAQITQAGDLYYADGSVFENSGNERGSYGGAGSLKDTPLVPDYTAPAVPSYPLTPSYKDQPYRSELPSNSIQYRGNGYGYNDGYCVQRWQIRENLHRHGWFGFHNRRIRGRVIKINAERRDGCIFRLRVDRCTGEILRKRLVSRPQSRYNGGSAYRSDYQRDNGRRYNIY